MIRVLKMMRSLSLVPNSLLSCLILILKHHKKIVQFHKINTLKNKKASQNFSLKKQNSTITMINKNN